MRKVYIDIIKPVLGTVLGLLGFFVLSPLMAALMIIISLESPGGAFFTQTRVGKKKASFHGV